MPARTIAIGDIHGCAQALAALIEIIAPQADDTLVLLGDYVNKGRHSRQVLDQLLVLRDCCRLVPLLGNHDADLLAVIAGELPLDSWLESGGAETLASYRGGDTSSIPAAHIEFLKTCRLYYETSTHIFVHAAYDPSRPMEEQDESVLLSQSLREGIPAPHESGKIAVVGHTSQKDGEILDADHLICIDTWCCGEGWLTAMDVETGRLWQVDQVGRLRE